MSFEEDEHIRISNKPLFVNGQQVTNEHVGETGYIYEIFPDGLCEIDLGYGKWIRIHEDHLEKL